MVTVTDPVTGKTSTVLKRTWVCGIGPPRMRADSSTKDEVFAATLFWPALKAEEAVRRLVYQWQ